MKSLFLAFSFYCCMALFACQSESPTTQQATPPTEIPAPIVSEKDLVGKTYLFAPELDSATCEATGGCDCCSSTVLFEKHNKFIRIDYCESDETFTRGHYRCEQNKVHLVFDTIAIDISYNHEREMDTLHKDEPEYFFELKKASLKELQLSSFSCKGTLCFHTDSEAMPVGSLDSQKNYKPYIDILRKQGLWEDWEKWLSR